MNAVEEEVDDYEKAKGKSQTEHGFSLTSDALPSSYNPAMFN